MQIPTLSLLSLLSSISLVSSSFGSLRPIHYDTPPSSSDQVTLNQQSDSGYQGPGWYNIINERTSLYVTLNGTDNWSLVNLQPPNNEDSQSWLIAAVETDPGNSKVIILSRVNGAYLLALTREAEIRAGAAPPWDSQARWTIAGTGTLEKRVVFESKAYPDFVLAHYTSCVNSDSQIIVNKLDKPLGDGQSWKLKYLNYDCGSRNNQPWPI